MDATFIVRFTDTKATKGEQLLMWLGDAIRDKVDKDRNSDYDKEYLVGCQDFDILQIS
jgi:hypothetical protein